MLFSFFLTFVLLFILTRKSFGQLPCFLPLEVAVLKHLPLESQEKTR